MLFDGLKRAYEAAKDDEDSDDDSDEVIFRGRYFAALGTTQHAEWDLNEIEKTFNRTFAG